VSVPELPLWLWSLLCIAGLAGGMAIHLAFHPLRQDFSDALDLLRNQPRLIIVGGIILYAHLTSASDGFHPLPIRLADEWSNWTALAPSLLEEAATRFAMLLHQVLPPWPAVYLLPVVLASSLWNLSRRPYRAGLRHRPRGGAWATLLFLLFVACLVPLAELNVFAPQLPESIETFLVGARLLSMGLLTACLQLGALRLAALWQDPPSDTSKSLFSTAWWQVLGRWRLLLPLTAFDVTWIALQSWSSLSPSHLVTWLLFEMLIFFAPLPVAVALATPEASFFQTGAHALRLLARSFLPLVGLTITAIAILALAHYAAGLLGSLLPYELPGSAFHLLIAFSLAFLHIWLFLTAALLLLRLGRTLIPPDPRPTA
jgi:hypothetical protein